MKQIRHSFHFPTGSGIRIFLQLNQTRISKSRERALGADLLFRLLCSPPPVGVLAPAVCRLRRAGTPPQQAETAGDG